MYTPAYPISLSELTDS